MTLEARFRLQKGDFLLDVDFEAPARGVTAIFGDSGAGKTLLLRTIAGLEEPDHGYFRIGRETWHERGRSLPTHRRPLGYVFQEASLFEHLSVRGNLDYAQKRLRKASRRLDRSVAIGLLGVEPLLERMPARLSGGERQRVAIARALLAGPRLLLMDEPLSSLDRSGRSEIIGFLERLHRELEIPVLYVSHEPEEVARLADHLVLLDKGRVQASGAIAETLTRTDLPPARTNESAAVVEAVVGGHEPDYELTYLDFAGGRFTVARSELPPGTPVRLRVLARDVSLTLEHQLATSILNIFPARVDELAALDGSLVIVRLDLHGTSLLSRVTRKSAEALRLAPGAKVFVQIKAVALLA